MNITTFKVAASFEVAVNTDSDMPPNQEGMATQLQQTLAFAVLTWQNKLSGSVIVGEVVVTVAAPAPSPAPEPPAPAPTPAPTDAPADPPADPVVVDPPADQSHVI
jgi:hypothetical protein